ncbi:transmembrane 9 superfamily member 9-like protein [Tanacetum coccineum]
MVLKEDTLRVKVNKLASTKTQLPYSYYSIPYCRPGKIVDSAENLGEVLRGDRIENSPYEFQMRVPQMCNVVCRIVLNEKTAKEFKEKIDDEYRVNMILDNLPLVVPMTRLERDSPVIYQHGYFVGRKVQYAGTKEEKYFINNHLTFTVKYHKDIQTDSARIVGFEVNAFSVKHQYDGDWTDKTRLTTCDAHAKRMVTSSDPPQEVENKKEIIFTYDVDFQESDIKWASRWDTYLLMADDQVHWFSIVNSLMIVLFLSGMVAMIMLRTLYRDISKYNQLETVEEAQEETGWKLVHGDVFRPPVNSDLLCVYVGTGVQFFGMILIAMIFAVLGFLSPSNRGGLMTALLLLWVLMGIFGGYASARLYKTFKGTEWKSITLKTAFMFPGIAFAIFFVLNALIWGEKSSGAVPFGTMFALVFLWFGISVPLVFVGSYIGFKKPAIEDPVKTNKIPRQIPEQACYTTTNASCHAATTTGVVVVAVVAAVASNAAYGMEISFSAKDTNLVEWQGDILAVGVTENDMSKDENSKFQNTILKELDSHLGGLLSEVTLEEDFTGKVGQSTVIRLSGLGFKRISLIGLGKGPTGSSTSAYHSLGESVASAAKASQANNVAIALASSKVLIPASKPATASAIAKGTLLGTYEDNRFKSEFKKSTIKSVDLIGLAVGPEVEKKLKYTEEVCTGVILAKELINSPANVVTPEVLAEEAEKIAAAYSHVFTATILDTEQCKELKMGSYLGVAAASANPLKFIHLCYKPLRGPIKTKLALVGKGLTYDR